MIVGAVGFCGTGKTYGTQRLVAAELRRPGGSRWRFLILDCNAEWPGAPSRGAGLRFALARSPGEAARALQSGHVAVLVRPAGMTTVADPEQDRQAANDLAQIAIACRAPTCLVLPECHRYIEEHKPAPPYVRTIIHQYRHTRTGMLWDTQQFADIRKELLRETVHGLRVYGQADASSLKALKERIGPRAAALAFEAGKRKRAGQPGWHFVWYPGVSDTELRLVR